MIRKKKREKELDEMIQIQAVEVDVAEEEENPFAKNWKNYTDLIYPSGIDTTNPQYIMIDGAYIATILCLNWPYQIQENYLDQIVNATEGVELFLNHTPTIKAQIIKDITHYMGFTKYKLNNQADSTESGTQENALMSSIYMKKQLAAGDELWYINAFVRVIGKSVDELFDKLRNVEATLTGLGIFGKRADFKQWEAFLSTLPIGKMNSHMRDITQRNILNSGLCALYPFTSSSLSDPNGFFMGTNIYDNSQVLLNIFNTSQYSNANICILGASGSGKTFTTQMLANRFRMQKIPVMMVCPLKGHEYRPLCENVGGNYFRFAPGSPHTVNILEIRDIKITNESAQESSLLAAKIQNVEVLFSIMFPDIKQKELQVLDEILIKVYAAKGITMDNSSLYQNGTSDTIIALKPKRKEMPILEDVYKEMDYYPEIKAIQELMKPFISGSLSFFNGQTNIDLENLYIVADISDIPEHLKSLAMYIVTDIFWDRIRANIAEKKILILDEIWKLLTASKVATFVVEVFKTIRGYGGGAIAATQDIEDFMLLENGKYGKAVLNSSRLKILLQMESYEIKAVKEILDISEEEAKRIEHFQRGNGLILAASNHIEVTMLPFETEKRLITTDREELIRYGRTGGR